MAADFEKVFKLGFGMMRLPRLESGEIDVEQTSVMVDKFLEAGGTYFDTAYVYEGSEEATRKALVERHPRESYTIATKLNAGVAKTAEEARRQFDISLERLGVGYFDFYLLHALGAARYDQCNEMGLWDFVREKKEQGLIRHIGFSFHDTPEVLDKILTEHPEVEFVQLQVNYADWENPDVQSRGVYETARKHGKYVVVMEPCKGGLLANPPKAAKALFDEANPNTSYASWAIRYVASKEGVLTVLSGMSNVEQMEDNLSYMRDFRPVDAAEEKVIAAAQEIIMNGKSIACTGCRYCVEGCPQQIPIPRIFQIRNQQLLYELPEEKAKGDYRFSTNNKGKASDCVQCRQCEDACPQHLPITELLEQCAAVLE